MKTRTITATARNGVVNLIGDTYPLRNELRSKGWLWNPDSQAWTNNDSADVRAYAASVATDGRVVDPPSLATTAPILPGPTIAPTETIPPAAPAVIEYNIAQADAPTRRRIKRTDETASTPDIAAALATFVASVAGNTASQPVDLTQVSDMIEKALAPIRQALAERPTERVEIVTQTETRTVDGLSHHMLPTLIKCLSAGLHVWLAGPSGSGKTHGAEQAAQALGLTFRLQGSMTMAHELTGFVDAGGKYHEPPFVTTFRNGGLILLDELDRGSNEALLALNAALANGVMCLPSGEIIRVHPDFRCIGAANTWGGGATHDYVGAARIDAAFLQRFSARLNWAYDEKLETAVTAMPEWSERVQKARAKAAANGLKVLITPRASLAGAKLIRAGFTPDEAANMTYLADLTDAQRKLLA